MKTRFDLSVVDFRTSSFENMFLDTYLAQAPDLALRIYLYGWMQALRATSAANICQGLDITEEQLEEGLRYWIKEGLVERKEVDGEEIVYFKSLILLWMGLYDEKEENAPRQEETSPIPSDNQNRRLVFDKLEAYLSEGLSYPVYLKENEILKIHELLDQYPMDGDFFLYAYQRACQMSESSSRSFQYIVAIIENWLRFEKISDKKALDAFLDKEKEKKSSKQRKKNAFVNKKRMSKEERSNWVLEKLRASRTKSLGEEGKDD